MLLKPSKQKTLALVHQAERDERLGFRDQSWGADRSAVGRKGGQADGVALALEVKVDRSKRSSAVSPALTKLRVQLA